LQQSAFERLAQVDALSKQKEHTAYVLEALKRIAQTGRQQAAAKGDSARLKQWHHIGKAVQTAQEALANSANTKLALTNLMLQL